MVSILLFELLRSDHISVLHYIHFLRWSSSIVSNYVILFSYFGISSNCKIHDPLVTSHKLCFSANVFGVSAESMHCSYDRRGNSVPTILLAMQRHLYLQEGLKVCSFMWSFLQ